MLAATFLLEGCYVGSDVPTVDLAELNEPGALAHASARAYPSDLVPDTDIDLWVSVEAVAAYARIEPDVAGSGASVPIGTLIVRQVLDASGHATKLTVMEKSELAANPTVGGWLFAVTDPAGVPLVEDGEVLDGALARCASCHQDRATDDFLFGVPLADRMP